MLRWSHALVSFLVACRPGDAAPSPMSPERRSPHPPAASLEHIEEPNESAGTETVARPSGTIYRSEIDRALRGGPGYLLRQLGPEPFRHGGHFVGWQITRVFPDDPELCTPGCDIRVGDVILSVEGDRLETPQALTRLLERVPDLDTLEVHSLREGKRRAVTYTLVEDRR